MRDVFLENVDHVDCHGIFFVILVAVVVDVELDNYQHSIDSYSLDP